MKSDVKSEARVEISDATNAPPERQGYVDVFRGLLIAHMALDHASLMFNAERGGEELAAAAPPAPGDIFQFLTRFTGVPVAPGFCFMAGFMVALTSIARQGRGVSHREITRRLVVRGLVLIAVDAIIMGLPRATVVGFIAGRDAVSRKQPARLWLLLSGVCLFLFLAVRLTAGYGNAYPYTSVTSLDFWFFAKYPPDLPFLTWSFAATFLALAVLWAMARSGTPALLRPFVVFGRVPFFFYVVHFYVLGVGAAIVRAKMGLLGTYGVTAAGTNTPPVMEAQPAKTGSVAEWL